MNRALSISAVGLTLVGFACSGEQATSNNQQSSNGMGTGTTTGTDSTGSSGVDGIQTSTGANTGTDTATGGVDGVQVGTGTTGTGTGTSGAGTTGTGTTATGTTGTTTTNTGGAGNTTTTTNMGGAGNTTTAGGGAANTGDTGGATSLGGATTTGNAGSMGTGGSTVVVAEPEPTLITSGPNAWWQIGELVEGGGNATVTVNDQELQDWDGFGGTFNEKGWDALKAVSAADRDLAIQLLFSKTDGAAFTYGRIPIGSSDYGLSRYSLNETAGDTAMANFSIERDRQDLIPYIKAAQAVNPNISFWASPWSPPTWMKDGTGTNGGFDGGTMRNEADILQAHANYLLKFVQAYAEEGITIEAVHPQNEPGFPQDYPSCSWDAATMTNYIGNYLGPTLEGTGIEIWLGTMSNSASHSIVTSVMGDATARGYVKGIGLQWAMGDANRPSEYASSYNIPVMQTEHKCGHYPWVVNDNPSMYPDGAALPPAPNDHAYALESWELFKNWIGKNVNSYLAWNMVLDTDGLSLDEIRPWAQNALITVNRGDGSLILTPTYFVFRHLSQYVEPGAVRLATSGGDALAFRNPDGSIVTVVHNSDGSASQTTLAVGGTTVQFEVPGQGWATVNWQG